MQGVANFFKTKYTFVAHHDFILCLAQAKDSIYTTFCLQELQPIRVLNLGYHTNRT